ETDQWIRKKLIEERYEVIETMDEDDREDMKEEVGDVVVQILLDWEMEEEVGRFNVYDVMEGLKDKVILRDGQVFGDDEGEDGNEGVEKWEEMKGDEKKGKGEDEEKVWLVEG
ncbi:MazG nucleotide pyrophosphohydrolase domain-containing protein, partial [Paenibacillus xylanexedens]|uniref:MazG nucleotide pyrophosphohydrolase domain-containing protein n=1 Tax=Paenibacillus xylanexedens TaxID=528191 RepID=UPI0028CBB54F